MINRLWNSLLDLVYPPRCYSCGKAGTQFCPTCLAECIPLTPPQRPQPLAADSPLERALGIYPFQGSLRAAIHAFKYQNAHPLAQILAPLLFDFCAWNDVVLMPVPLHGVRKRERGYNQAELLARHLAKAWQLPLSTDLQRVRATEHQVGQQAQARASNVAGAFEWRGQQPAPSHVLLIDDVLTTGSTFEACARALIAAGSTAVEGLALAKAIIKPAPPLDSPG